MARGAMINMASTESADIDVRAPSPVSRKTIDELARLGHRLDAMVPQKNPLLNRQGTIAEQIKKTKLVLIERDRPELDRVAERVDAEALRTVDARLEIARVLARSLIDKRSKACDVDKGGDGPAQDEICDTVERFRLAHMLDTSGKDVLATAILMPKVEFREKQQIWSNNLRTMAAYFRVPMAAVALRQRILQHSPE